MRDLTEKLNNKITRQSIHLYEQGKNLPSELNFMLLCEALELTSDYFTRPEVKLTKMEFRIEKQLPAKELARLEAKASDFMSRYLELEELLGEVKFFKNDLNSDEVRSFEEVEAKSIELRKKWLLGDGPLMNVIQLLEERGIKVMEDVGEPNFDGMSANAGEGLHLIVLKRKKETEEEDVPRIRFTTLHELAHHVLNIPDDITIDLKERFCHYFASAMLFPNTQIDEHLGGKRQHIHLVELLRIKELFGISMQAMLYRFRKLGYISEYHYWSQMDELVKKYGKKKEPNVFCGREKPIRFENLLFRGYIEQVFSKSKAASLYGVDVPTFIKKSNELTNPDTI